MSQHKKEETVMFFDGSTRRAEAMVQCHAGQYSPTLVTECRAGSAPAPRIRGAQCLPGPEIWSEEGASIIVLQMSFRPTIYQSGASVGKGH